MKIHIIYCGGTLAMEQGENGWQANQNFESLWRKVFEPMHTIHNVNIHSLTPAIDSANLKPSDWNRLRQVIEKIEDDANILIIHGTDTLNWTAAYLYLMNRRHKIVITGSQRPAITENSDAFANVDGAIRQFKNLNIGQSVIYFGERIIDAQNSIKFSSNDDAAFVHFLDPISNQDPLLALPSLIIDDECVEVVRLTPAMTTPDVSHAKFVIIEAFGAGNGPDENDDFMRWLRNLIQHNIHVGLTSQCVHGGVYQANYGAGNSLIKAGAVLLEGFTTQAAFARAHFLAKQNIPEDAKKRFWQGKL